MTNFTTTFTLSQEGTEGDVVARLEFEPRVGANGDVPPCYEAMSQLVLGYLQKIEAIDEDNNVIDQKFFDNVSITASEDRTKH